MPGTLLGCELKQNMQFVLQKLTVWSGRQVSKVTLEELKYIRVIRSFLVQTGTL